MKKVKFNKWTAGKHEVKQAGVRIPENLIKGRSKIGVGEITNQSQYQKVRSTFNIKEKPKTNTHRGKNKTGGGVTEKNFLNTGLQQAENTNTRLTDNTQEHRIQNKQEQKTQPHEETGQE